MTTRLYLSRSLCTLVIMALLIFCDDTLVQGQRRIRHHRRAKRNTELNKSPQDIEFERNFQLVTSSRWACAPKPKLVYLNEALNQVPPLPPYMTWLVDAAEVHRCEPSSGCCLYPTRCSPEAEHVRTVTVYFKKIDMTNNVSSYEPVQFSNHTRCACT